MRSLVATLCTWKFIEAKRKKRASIGVFNFFFVFFFLPRLTTLWTGKCKQSSRRMNWRKVANNKKAPPPPVIIIIIIHIINLLLFMAFGVTARANVHNINFFFNSATTRTTQRKGDFQFSVFIYNFPITWNFFGNSHFLCALDSISSIFQRSNVAVISFGMYTYSYSSYRYPLPIKCETQLLAVAYYWVLLFLVWRKME